VANLEADVPPLSVTFSPDGSLVAGAHDDGSIQLWDAATGALLRSIRGPAESSLAQHDQQHHGIDFSPDGKQLLATGPGYALIWNVEVDPRSPADVDAVVAAKSPWRLVDGRLVPRAP
jgi:WD40 repeat protein